MLRRLLICTSRKCSDEIWSVCYLYDFECVSSSSYTFGSTYSKLYHHAEAACSL